MYKRIALILMLMLVITPPVFAAAIIDQYSPWLVSGSVIPNGTDPASYGSYLQFEATGASWVTTLYACTNTVNSSGYSTPADPDGIQGTISGALFRFPSINPGSFCNDKTRLTGWAFFSGRWYQLVQWNFNYTAVPPLPSAPPAASYSCNFATGGYAPNPSTLQCVGNTTFVNPAVTNTSWLLTQPDNSTYSTTNTTLVKLLNQNGWHGLDYRVCNSMGCGYANTTQQVNVTTGIIPATGISFWVHIYDPLKSAKIADSTLRVTNATYPAYYTNHYSTSGSYLITKTSGIDAITAGQSINLTGSATGYETANQTVTVPYDGWEYILNLVATSDVPTGANATLVVNAINSYTAESIEGATITISNNTIPYSSSKLSNAGGSVTFASIPAGRYQISASKTGYQSSTTTWGATASTVTTAYIGLLPVGATPVVTGTAGNPLFDADGNPIVGYDANGNPITAAPTQDTRTAAEKDAGMADLLRNNGESLIMLFILFTIIYMIKGIGR